MCDGCNQIHDPAKMFGNGKHICLSCPMIPLTSYYEVAQNRVRCINALSNLAPGDLKVQFRCNLLLMFNEGGQLNKHS